MPLTEEGIIKVPGLLSRWCRLGNGEKAHYMTAGETGPAVILLHGGIPGSSGTAGWRFMAPFLGAHGFRVYCPDQPGFGLSDTRPEYHPVNGVLDHVDFVNRFADAMCLEDFFISGNSMGCITTAHYVVRYPHRVRAFVLIAGFIGDHYIMDIEEELRTPVAQTSDSGQMKDMMTGIIRNKAAITPELIEMRTLAAERNTESWEKWHRANNFRQISHDVELALSTKNRIDRLDTPGIYMYGLNDVILPHDPIGWAQEDLLPRIQFFYPDDCGHQGQTDQPELFNQVFLEFFRDGHVSRATADRAGVSTRRPELPNLVQTSADVSA
jgi:2-hydroxy-6-oxonona-2,4-dienedioate hydrolase